MLKISKILSGNSPFSPQAIGTLAHNLVFKNGFSATDLEHDLNITLEKALEPRQLLAFNNLDENEKTLVLENFRNALEDALYDLKYSDFEDDGSDDDTPGLRKFTH